MAPEMAVPKRGQAACAYRKQKDAGICDDEAKEAMQVAKDGQCDGRYDWIADGATNCADKIRSSE